MDGWEGRRMREAVAGCDFWTGRCRAASSPFFSFLFPSLIFFLNIWNLPGIYTRVGSSHDLEFGLAAIWIPRDGVSRIGSYISGGREGASDGQGWPVLVASIVVDYTRPVMG